MTDLRLEFSQDFEMELDEISLIQENKYCAIYRTTIENSPYIIKKYKGEDNKLCTTEASSLGFYKQVASEIEGLYPAGTKKFLPEKNLILIEFVPGEPFSKLVYNAKRGINTEDQCLNAADLVGKFLRNCYLKTRSNAEPVSPFILKYIRYTSSNLASMPVLGKTHFSDAEASCERLCSIIQRGELETSFIHGDLVLLNIHVNGDQVGLIDFANTNDRSHVLNDVYNFRLALQNMLIPDSFSSRIWDSFYEPLREFDFPDELHEFYFEYHRRRWLMLKLSAKSPKAKLQGIRGLLGFAKPWSSDRKAR